MPPLGGAPMATRTDWEVTLAEGFDIPSPTCYPSDMPLTRAEVEREALALSDEDRIILGERLLLSVSDRAEIDDAWDDEIARRVEEIRSRKVEGIPAEEAHARIRARLS